MEFIAFLRILKAEPFMFLYMVALGLRAMTNQQMIQDKVCRNEYNQTIQECANIQSKDATGPVSAILSRSATVAMYTNIIPIVPQVIYSLWIGSWIDSFRHGLRNIMLFVAFSSVMESVLMLINATYFSASIDWLLASYVPMSLGGGLIFTLTAVYAYASATTPAHLKSLRYIILELGFLLALPLAIYLGTSIFSAVNPNQLDSDRGPIRNYVTCYWISFGVSVLSGIWAFFAIKPIDKKLQEENSEVKSEAYLKRKNINSSDDNIIANEENLCRGNSDGSIELSEDLTSPPVLITTVPSSKLFYPIYEFFSTYFAISHVKDTLRTALKPRPNGVRREIWLCYVNMVLIVFSIMGGQQLAFSFVQKAYHWNAMMLAVINVITCLWTAFAGPLIIWLCSNKFKISDYKLGIVGATSCIIPSLLKGTFLIDWVYITCVFLGAANGVPSVAIRSRLSKLLPHDEVGKIFSLVCTLELSIPLAGSALFTSIFTATIDSYIGLVYQLMAALLIPALAIFCWLDLYAYQPVKKIPALSSEAPIQPPQETS